MSSPNAARYHKGALPKKDTRISPRSTSRIRRQCGRLGGIIRVADALDKSDVGSSEMFVAIEGDISATVQFAVPSIVKEIWAAEQKRDMFEQAYGCKLVFSRRAQAKAPEIKIHG